VIIASSLFTNCLVERCALVKIGTLAANGLPKYVDEDYRILPCSRPLWSDIETRTGVCNSCFSGWSHPDNAPTPKGEAQIAAAHGVDLAKAGGGRA
jgi:hypothetical protein